MRRAIIWISDRLDTASRIAAVASFVAMLAFISIQVVARYLLDAPPTWTEELARFAMVWGGLLGATIAFKARFDPVLIHLPTGGLRAVKWAKEIVQGIAVVIFLGPVLFYSIFGAGFDIAGGFLGRSAQRTADTLGFSMIYMALAVPVSVLIILIHLSARFAGDQPATGAPAASDEPS